jgi:hypothetical protein
VTDNQPAPGPTVLDWSGRDGVRHWGGGQARSCRSCHQPAFLVDDGGRPQHKVCAEVEARAEAGADAAVAREAVAPVRQRTRETPRPQRATRHLRLVPEPEAEVLW